MPNKGRRNGEEGKDNAIRVPVRGGSDVVESDENRSLEEKPKRREDDREVEEGRDRGKYFLLFRGL